MAERIYWDACAWIGLINAEADKVVGCQHCMDLAKEGKVQIWTSALTLAEVFKKKCGNRIEGIEQDSDDTFAQFVAQEFVVLVNVDQEIGEKARELLRKHASLKKPADAIHLATAAIHSVEALYTFDKDNLLDLSGLVTMANGAPLTICNPPHPPKVTGDQFSLFDLSKTAPADAVSEHTSNGKEDEPFEGALADGTAKDQGEAKAPASGDISAPSPGQNMPAPSSGESAPA